MTTGANFNRIRAFLVIPRTSLWGLKPLYPKFEWDYRNKRFKWIDKGWHSKPTPADYDKETHICYYSDLKFKNGKPMDKFGPVWLLTD